MKKGKKVWIAVAGILLAAGILLLISPHIINNLFQRQSDITIEEFKDAVDDFAADDAAKDETAEGDLDKSLPGGADLTDPYEDLYRRMREYNVKLFETGQSGLTDPFAYEQPSFDLTQFGFAENVVGYIEIPKMEVRMPIYLGAGQENMEKGAVHLSQTSLPIGGENTNCVIAAHRGSYRGLMFRNIHLLESGDTVSITNFRETLTYSVDKIKIISPDAVDQILIQPGRDMVTLSTCNPLWDNYQRYIVYCERKLP